MLDNKIGLPRAYHVDQDLFEYLSARLIVAMFKIKFLVLKQTVQPWLVFEP